MRKYETMMRRLCHLITNVKVSSNKVIHAFPVFFIKCLLNTRYSSSFFATFCKINLAANFNAHTFALPNKRG